MVHGGRTVGIGNSRPGGTRSARAPITQTIKCGAGAEGQLRAAGDANAAGDSSTCFGNQILCGTGFLNSAPNRVAVVRVQLNGGAAKFAGTGCDTVAAAKPVVTVAAVRAQAVRLIPAAAIGLAPKATSLVNIQTVMWVAAPGRQVLPTAQILGQRVTISLRLTQVQWTFGDGHGATTSSPGKSYDRVNAPCRSRLCPGYFGHVYDRTGPMQLRATAQWTASFTVNGGAAQQIPGTVAGTGATADLTIKQARSVLVPN